MVAVQSHRFAQKLTIVALLLGFASISRYELLWSAIEQLVAFGR
jgi:hypothetical protein